LVIGISARPAIANLLTKADRYFDPGGGIQVEVSDGESVTLRVIDNGPGVESEVAERLFRDPMAAGRGRVRCRCA
jgi:signal transduction histidine kinase